MLNKTSDLAFKKYLTSKTQQWLLRFGCNEPAGVTMASPAPAGARDACAGDACAAMPACLPVQTLSDDEEDGASLVGGPTSMDDA
jgi:hypothetical protein